MYLAAAELDPLLDDSVVLAGRLRKLQHQLSYHVFEDLPHGVCGGGVRVMFCS